MTAHATPHISPPSHAPTPSHKPAQAIMTVSAESQLLLAVMATQLGFAPAQAVIAGLAAWSVDRSVDLSARLLSQGVLTHDQCKLLQQLLQQTQPAAPATPSLPPTASFESFGASILQQSSTPAVPCAPSNPGLGYLVQEPNARYIPLQENADKAELGRGGIGRVLEVFDRVTGRRVALKELLDDTQPMEHNHAEQDTAPLQPTNRLRLLAEARLTAQLEHPNIVPIYEVGQRMDGSIYYTMKRVHGRTLSQALRACGSLEERLGYLDHFVDLCQALAYAHSRGVIHRDLKPSNVMVGTFGETVLLDWGLAKVRATDAQPIDEEIQQNLNAELQRELQLLRQGATGKTIAGEPIGTPSYMSPEQAEGDIEAIDEQSDVWGLGAILYEILTGRPPIVGQTPLGTVGKILRQEQIPPPTTLEPSAPLELSLLCMRCLSHDKTQRLAGVKPILARLEAFQRSSIEQSMAEMEEILTTYLSPGALQQIRRDHGAPRTFEMREMTYMFTDIVGFSALLEQYSIEEIVEQLLSPYFEIVVNITTKWRGDVNKFIGDSALVIFDHDENDAPDLPHDLQGFQAALEIQHAFQHFLRETGPLQNACAGMCIGLHRGPAYAGHFGFSQRLEYTVLGEAVNVTSRLTSRAKAHQIALSEEIHQTLQGLSPSCPFPYQLTQDHAPNGLSYWLATLQHTQQEKP